MENKMAYRYSDEAYLTKEEIKRDLKVASVDNLWKKIEDYRSQFSRRIDLFSLDNKPIRIFLVPGIYEKFARLEHRLTKLERSLPKDRVHQIHEHAMFSILKYLKDVNNLDNTTEETLWNLVLNKDVDIEQDEILLQKYLLALKEIETRHASPFNKSTLNHLYTLLVKGERFNNEDYEIYKIMENVDLGQRMQELFDFVQKESVFPTLSSALTLYCILIYAPFECFNEEMAILSMKYVLEHQNIHLFDLPFERFLSDLFNGSIKEILNKCEEYNDATYFLSYFLKMMDTCLLDFENILQEELKKAIKDEEYQEIEEEEEEITTEDINNQDDVKEETSYNQNLNVVTNISLPPLFQGLDEKDIDLVSENLLELYPSLKKGQARFYARHCTVGKYYSISQYKKEVGCAYETARTSMDNLASLGFYKKEKMKNRFLYTPVNRFQ